MRMVNGEWRIANGEWRMGHPLFVLCLTFTILVLMHTMATPVFEAPDEVWHYAYVRWLAEGHGLPAMDNNDSGANQEVAQPPLYYVVAALVSAPFADDDLDLLMWGNPGFGYQGALTGVDNKNMLVHTDRERFPWRGAALAIHMTRFTSMGFGLLAVVAAWGLGYETFGSRRGALLTAALVAFHPQFIFISSVVSNDSAAAALCTATLWSIARGFRHGTNTRHALFTGALAGLCALTKTSAMLMVGAAGVGILVQSLRQPELLSQIKSQASYELRITPTQSRSNHVSRFIFATLIVGGWWYARNWLLYGAPMGMSSHTGTLWGRPEPVSLWALFPKDIGLLLKSFWAAYGWGHIMWADWVYVGLWGIGGILLIVSLVELVRMANSELRITNYELRITNYAGNVGAVSRFTPQTLTLIWALCWFGGIFLALLQWMRQVEAPHGRLLFPAIGAWAVLVAGAVERQKRPGSKVESRDLGFRVQDSGFRILLIGMVGLATLAPGLRIQRALGYPRLRSTKAVLREVTPVNYTFGEHIRLLGIELDDASTRVAPGESFDVRACWEAVQAIPANHTIFVHLIGPENSRVAERHTYPGLGRFPTSLWPEQGKAFCDTYQVAVEPWAIGPRAYLLEMGIFATESQPRSQAQRDDGTVVDPPVVGEIIVAPTPPAVITPTVTSDATLDNSIRLRGYDAPTQAQAGEDVALTLYWEALRDLPDTHYIAFIHLWQPGDAEPRAQSDGPPDQGWSPTRIWQGGDIIQDTHILHLPADLPPGTYPLWAGMYRASDGTRLTAVGTTGEYLHNLIPLGKIVIDKAGTW